jgi:sec-independent protein translocase protein TatC
MSTQRIKQDMTFIQHLVELRDKLLHSVIAILLVFAGIFVITPIKANSQKPISNIVAYYLVSSFLITLASMTVSLLSILHSES